MQAVIIWNVTTMNSTEERSCLKTAHKLPCPGDEDYCVWCLVLHPPYLSVTNYKLYKLGIEGN